MCSLDIPRPTAARSLYLQKGKEGKRKHGERGESVGGVEEKKKQSGSETDGACALRGFKCEFQVIFLCDNHSLQLAEC